MTKEELLKVLDMSEDEQCLYLYKHFKKEYYPTDEWPQWYGICDILSNNIFPGRKVILADLAFRLRDEAIAGTHKECGQDVSNRYSYSEAQRLVYHKSLAKKYEHLSQHGMMAIWNWYAQPIHWIIAALIAKEVK